MSIDKKISKRTDKLDKINELVKSPSNYFMKRGSNSIYDFDKCWNELKKLLNDN